MKAHEIKKGTKVYFKDGRVGIIKSKVPKTTNIIQMVEILPESGMFHETGSCYVHDLLYAEIDGKLCDVSLTPQQMKKAAEIRSWGF